MTTRAFFTTTAILVLSSGPLLGAANQAPNIVVILTDDQGYADISLNPHHPKEVSTPHMDALAKDGVMFSQAYTSGNVCSPTRAGLMLGRYQQRVGVYSAGDGGRGFDPSIPIFPSFLPEKYVSTAIGKWHLGLDSDFPALKWHAMSRGFDECYKFMGRGGHDYFDLRSDSEGKFAHPIYRNKQRINDKGYLTDRLTEEAVGFIDRNKSRPFLLYLAYNAVHAPPQAPRETIESFRRRFPGLPEKRVTLMAMLKHLDDGVGAVVAKLRKERLFENTLVFFLTDNGGSRAMTANNAPLRGFKGSLFEGGIRTPMIVSWPAKFGGGRSISTPVISLDILPTVLDAVGDRSVQSKPFDGKSLLPLLTGKATTHHDTLYFSEGSRGEWAVRRGNWKLYGMNRQLQLFNLAKDPAEKVDLSAKSPDQVKELKTAFDHWIEQMADPITGGEKRAESQSPGPDKPLTARQAKKTSPAASEPAEVASTLTGKVMVGYQGWFNCPGDGAKLGWKHWARDRTKPFAPGNVTIDLWPDVSELDPDELYATGFKHADGSPASVFSSANRKTVLRHFRWMRDYGIDGAFLQRFAVGLSGRASLRNNNTLLSHVREGARQSGRAFAVMYDLSGLRGGQVNRVRGDWMKLRTELNVADDEHYLHHNGKPLVAVWGIGFSDDRPYSLRECFELVKWIKSSGCSVMLGVPSFWRERKRDAVDDLLLHEIIKAADVVSPWTIGRYRNPGEATRHATKVWQPDRKWCERENVDFLPVVFPGFSWHNLHGGKLDQIPRLKGEFFWSQVKAAKGIGCDMIYVAMFDEVDEATAIFKCTNIPPTADNAKFITYEGLPGDHYLKLTGKAGQLLRNEIAVGDSPLRESECRADPRPEKKAKPNVLFIVCDDLNTHVSTSGYRHIRTPAFDALAQSGMRFGRAYCQYPVCGPSRASFLTGLYPESTGVLDNKLDIRQTRPGTQTMPQCFREQGYWTASVGKVFHSPRHEPGEAAWNQFLRFQNDEMPHVTVARKAFEAKHGPVDKGKARRLWKNHLNTLSTQTRGQQRPGYGRSGLRDEQHKDGKNVRQVVSWLDRKTQGEKPFFIACGIQKPHVPFLAPDRYFQMYPTSGLRFSLTPAGFWDQAPRSAMVKRFQGFGFTLAEENDSLRREYTQAYHACISFIDAQIGMLLESLERNGLRDNTIVVLTSDHGYQLGEHFMWGKVTLFEVCDRVPLVVRVPGLTRPRTSSDGLVELVDLFPTLAELCSVKPPADLQGRSLVPMLRDPTSPGKRVAYTVVSRGERLGKAIRSGRWRYALWPDGEELYDLVDDPDEYVNLATSTKHADVIAGLRAELALAEKTAVARRKQERGSTPQPR